ncbi:DUF305 domain-containing protein [Planctomonas deserti]|uniref:DUF305 domain-containing protein n=1 Tax=Planctomonas deserti TaxID=2144185 RepID=UPI001F0CD181|nr:DUF305 domain-containing protein [Planctomonas deserti]
MTPSPLSDRDEAGAGAPALDGVDEDGSTQYGNEDDLGTESETEGGRRYSVTTRLIVAAILAATLLLVVGFGAGRFSADRFGEADAAPGTSSAEAGFARDMQVHHQQAVQLSVLVRDRSQNEEVRQLALDIATSQGQQAGQMYAWLASWGLSQAPSGERMAWMSLPTLEGDAGHGHSAAEMAGGAMPGLASDEDIARLEAAGGTDADRIFLELMIAHHRGGVEMAEAVLDRSTNELVTPLARNVVLVQQGEIDYMESLLAEL